MVGKSTDVQALGIAGGGAAAATPAFQQAGYRTVDLGGSQDAVSMAKSRGVPFLAWVDATGTEGSWWDGFFDYSMRVIDCSNSSVVWSATAEYGQAGIFINQTKSTQEAMRDMVADFSKSFPPGNDPSFAIKSPSAPENQNGLRRSGTGFFVTSNGHCLSAHHVVEGCRNIQVIDSAGKSHTAAIERSLPSLDLVLLKIDAVCADWLALPQDFACSSGDQVFTVGFPTTEILGSEAKVYSGNISSLTGLANDASTMQITIPIQPGNSGGAVVVDSGEVVGIVIGTAAPGTFWRQTGALPQNVNFAIRSDFAKALIPPGALHNQRIRPGRSSAIDLAKRASVRIVAE